MNAVDVDRLAGERGRELMRWFEPEQLAERLARAEILIRQPAAAGPPTYPTHAAWLRARDELLDSLRQPSA